MALGTLFTPKQRHVSVLKPNEDRLPLLVYCIDHAVYEILCVCGEADPNLWEDELLIQAIRRFLSRGSDSHLIFTFSRSEACDTPEQAVVSLKESNPKLVGVVGEFSNKVQIYWTPIRPEAHYAIFDSSIMFESRHTAYGSPEVTFIFNRPHTAAKWRGHFFEFIKHAHLLQVAG